MCENCRNNHGRGGSGMEVLGAMVLGAVAGAVAGMLLAPQSGEETRKQLRRKAQDAQKEFARRTEDVRDELEKRAKSVGKDLREQAVRMQKEGMKMYKQYEGDADEVRGDVVNKIRKAKRVAKRIQRDLRG